MTKEEILEQLKHDRDLCNFNPSTGESEPIDEDCRKSAEALDYAIKAIKIVEKFERAQIITGGRLNGRTYAYKCGLEDGKRKALEQNTVSEETYTQEYFARKEAEQKLWVLQQNVSDDCVSRKAVTDAVENTIAKYIPTFIGQYEKIPLELAKAIGDVQPVTIEISTGRRNGKTYEYYSKTMYKDKSLLEWAIIWLKTSNDAFFEEYGFNFNPHEYKGLYELAMKCRDGLHIGAINCTQNLTTMAAQLQSGLNGLQYGV